MSDTSNLSVNVHGVTDPRVIKGIKGYLDDIMPGCYHNGSDTTSLEMGANDISLGTSEEVHDWLKELVTKGLEIEDPESGELSTIPVEDFAWSVHDDPAYEWLGSLYMHADGMDFNADCDSDGTPIVNVNQLRHLVEAATDLAVLKEQVTAATGAAVIDAYNKAKKESSCSE